MRAVFLAMCLGATAPAIEQPPAAYRGEVTVVAHFVVDVDATCRALGITTPPDWVIYGCHEAGQVWLPLPCDRSEWFANLSCHEAGHALGWSHK